MMAYAQVTSVLSGSARAVRFSCRSTSAGGRPTSARAKAVVLIWAITAVAAAPCPMMSPTMSPVLPPASGTMSYQSPPTSYPSAGRHRPAISSRARVVRVTAGSRGCSASATDRCRISASELAIPVAARAARSAAAAVSRLLNNGEAEVRDRTRKPTVTPRVIMGAAINEVYLARSICALGRARRSVVSSGWAKITGECSRTLRA
jgi:hypothetical protein